MRVKVVSIKELTEDNPTLCLSALRVFNDCHECPTFKRAQAHNTIDKLKCKPHIKPRYWELLKRKKAILKQLRTIETEIQKLSD